MEAKKYATTTLIRAMTDATGNAKFLISSSPTDTLWNGPLLGVLAFDELLPCFKQSLAVLYKTPRREMRRVSFF